MKVEIVESYYAAQIQLGSIKIHTNFLRLYGMNFDEIIDYFYSKYRVFKSLNIQVEF